MVVTPRSFNGRDPLREDRRHGGVALRIDAADLARAVIHVEVGGDQLLLRLDFERPGGPAQEFRQLHLVGRGGGLSRSEVLGRVALRAEQALLLARPEGDANGAAGLDVERFRMRTASMATMVPAPLSVAPVPAIQLSRWPPTITTCSFRRGSVPGISATVLKACSCSPVNFGFDVHLHADGHVRLGQPIEPAIALDGRHHHRHFHPLVGLIRSAPQGGAVVVEQGAA